MHSNRTRLTSGALLIFLLTAGSAWAEPKALSREACFAKFRDHKQKIDAIAYEMDAEIAYSEAHGGAFSPYMTREFVNWYRTEETRHGSDLPPLHETNLSPAERAAKEAAPDRFMRERLARHAATMAELDKNARAGCGQFLPPDRRQTP